jgi:hypothetical protein
MKPSEVGPSPRRAACKNFLKKISNNNGTRRLQLRPKGQTRAPCAMTRACETARCRGCCPSRNQRNLPPPKTPIFITSIFLATVPVCVLLMYGIAL